ncbi:MAG TPA: DNA replication and repair protein RecF [Solirubrobacteraceae bacterium]|nr:DNA replication and repair protein RecF [Solirubrobacteraceae bacterium]
MRVLGLSLRDFRGYGAAQVELGGGLTVITGPNGAGKTNLLEALYFGCTGRSCRTSNERELVAFGAPLTRVEVETVAADGPHHLAVAFVPGQPKRMTVDGSSVERLLDAPGRPLVSVFLPDRLELIKGAPSLRRAHLDQFVGAMWPARTATRRAYAQALAQRNALIARIRAGRAGASSLDSWDRQLAGHGWALMGDRTRATESVAARFADHGSALGLDGELELRYRPRSKADDVEGLLGELADRRESDLERGFSGHGPHRDELVSLRDGRDLRVYGSQGQQRLGLLALLLAERDALTATRDAPPLMLLDDVMSELDVVRREALVERLRASAGQVVITSTDLEHVPGARENGIVRLAVSAGRVLQDAVAA